MSPGAVTESGRERAALCGELERVGPAAPTLCGGRSADELLSYLLMRERRYLVSLLGVALPAVERAAIRRVARLPCVRLRRHRRARRPPGDPLRWFRGDMAWQ